MVPVIGLWLLRRVVSLPLPSGWHCLLDWTQPRRWKMLHRPAGREGSQTPSTAMQASPRYAIATDDEPPR
eukprot:1067940-Prorocentrum_lima.AAC.1